MSDRKWLAEVNMGEAADSGEDDAPYCWNPGSSVRPIILIARPSLIHLWLLEQTPTLTALFFTFLSPPSGNNEGGLSYLAYGGERNVLT